jgi:hypothetical protein
MKFLDKTLKRIKDPDTIIEHIKMALITGINSRTNKAIKGGKL